MASYTRYDETNNDGVRSGDPDRKVPSVATLRGDVRRITFRNEDNQYTVVKLTPETSSDDEQEVTVVGNFPSIAVGEWLELEGGWVIHPQFGRQFQSTSHRKLRPENTRGIERYLASGAIPGVGPALAKRLVSKFGAQTIDVIEKHPERLLDVEGIGKRKKESIVSAFKEEDSMRQVFVFLHEYGIAPGTASKIFKEYGADTIARVKENPYRLADDIFGVGFKTADRIATEMGIPADSLKRGRAAVVYLLNEANAEGHVYLPYDKLVDRAGALGLTEATVEEAVDALDREKEIVSDNIGREHVVYPSFLHYAEGEVAGRIGEMTEKQSKTGFGVRVAGLDAHLSDEQKNAVGQAVAPGEGLLVITGGPGTGKTTTLRAIVDALEAQGDTVELAAPTGRAAKRLQEATGREARTIHRLLEYAGGDGGAHRFQKNERNPLKADVTIVDEASMIDLPLVFHLLRAIRRDAKLILVGDQDQLPSVGPGNVLRDILHVPIVKSIRLTRIFRQAEESSIVVNAHRIQRGLMPRLGGDGSDFFFMHERDPVAAAHTLTDVVSRRVPDFLGVNPLKDIQVLAAVRRGPLGVDNLNALLQDKLNPGLDGDPSVVVGSQTLRIGDRVMQIRNDYDKMVYNGDIGRVVSIDTEQKNVGVFFPDREEPGHVIYDSGSLRELVLAYCTSVHKSQGSEYPAIVMPITWVMPALMNRNLLYTAITRARRFVVLIGRKDALSAYVRQARVDDRYTGLAERLAFNG